MAWFLADSFAKTDVVINCICSRNLEQGKQLANTYHTNYVDDVLNLDSTADITFIALSDDAIELISNTLKVNGMVLHCSGILPVDVLTKHNLRGVLYPLQTIIKTDLPDVRMVPICLEANNEEGLQILKTLAYTVTKHIHFVNSQQRQYYHLAAVLVNNFTNHFYALADNILGEHHLSFDLLKPLILETARKAYMHPPIQNQTGPAKRDDRNTIEKHISLLNDNSELKELYEKITQSIFNLHQKI